MVNLEKVREEAHKICVECYELCEENESYFIARGETSYEVRKNILERLSPELQHLSMLDTALYIIDVNGDVYINIT